ncbi:4Fe-4S single cluster domain containing protein [uncultured Caudovirales phage]|uniref:4Fe-4S single cluster domain containing protein n=1 Tax=uncultured Caudovirales phage TaxID=2100421 RepID=A0A6J5T9Q2_9CAUD|nr:4Fe-4S single cluster domain containing protein [uncultured Caudovirales phage]
MSEYNYAYGNLNETPQLRDIFSGSNANALRKEMLDNPNSLPGICNKCSVREVSGMPSYRTQSNIKYKDIVEKLEPNADGTAEFKQVYIDYRFSNKCNFKCITCGPTFSSSHAVEFKKLGIKASGWDGKSAYIEVDSDSFLPQFKEFSKDIREIYFAGGEPLINDHHYDILEWLIETQQPVDIFYNTNFSDLSYKKYDILDMWSKVNGKVDIFASVDGFGEWGRVIRYGFDQQQFEDNAKKVFESGIKNLRLKFSITHGITNYRQVVNTTEWLMNLFPADFECVINFNPIIMSPEFSELFLNAEQRKRATEIVTKQIAEFKIRNNTPHGRSCARSLENIYLQWVSQLDSSAYPDEGKRKNIKIRWLHMDATDSIRGIDWKKILPDMVNDYLEIWDDLDARGIEMEISNEWTPTNKYAKKL